MRSHVKSSESITQDTPNENVEDMVDMSNSFSVLESLESELESLKDYNMVTASSEPIEHISMNGKDQSDTVKNHSNKEKRDSTINTKNDSSPKPKNSNAPRIKRDSKSNENIQHHNPSKGHPAGFTAGKKKQ